MPQLSARRISGDLVEYLADSKPHPARVHSLFTRAFNLKVADGCLVSGTNSRGYIAPMGFSFQSLLTSGWPFSLDQELILHPGGVCSASGELLIDFSNAAIWNKFSYYFSAGETGRAPIAHQNSEGTERYFHRYYRHL